MFMHKYICIYMYAFVCRHSSVGRTDPSIDLGFLIHTHTHSYLHAYIPIYIIIQTLCNTIGQTYRLMPTLDV